MIGLALVIGIGGVMVTREPKTPYGFLNKYPISESKTSKDGKLRIVVLKGDITTIWNDIRTEFSGKRTFSSNGYMSINGIAAEYMSLGTEEGLIKVSNDLSFANEGFSTVMSSPELKTGYCAVAFTRPKTIFDRAMEWMRNFFSPSSKTAPPPPKSSTTIQV